MFFDILMTFIIQLVSCTTRQLIVWYFRFKFFWMKLGCFILVSFTFPFSLSLFLSLALSIHTQISRWNLCVLLCSPNTFPVANTYQTDCAIHAWGKSHRSSLSQSWSQMKSWKVYKTKVKYTSKYWINSSDQ